MKGILASSLLFAAITGAAAPATDPDDTIIVTASRTEIPLARATVPVEVITRDEIELSLATDLAELLRFEAGLDIGRNGGPGQATSVFMRGTESNHTLVLVDGVRINPGTLGGAAIQNIAPEMIERVEIVKGSRSALFGTDAIGGVINIITRGGSGAYGELSAGGGSFATRNAYLALGSEDFGIAVNRNETEGYPIQRGNPIDRGYDNTSIQLRAAHEFGGQRLAVSHWSARGTSEYLDFFSSPLDQDFENSSTALEWRSSAGARLDSKLIVAHMVDDISQNQSDDFVESTRISMDWQSTLTAGDHSLTGGLYYVDENAATLSFGSGFDEDTAVRAVFLQDQWTNDRHRALLALRYTDHETFGRQATWNAEYSLDVGEDWSILAGAGRAFRAPDATDRFGFGGNRELLPEIAREFQAGVRYRPAGRHAVSLELYRNDISNLIEFDLETFQLRNIARAEIRGAELSWDYRGDGFTLRTSLVRQEANNPDDGLRLLRRAERSLTVKLTRDIGRHRLGLSVLASGERRDVGGTVLPGYAIVDLTGQLALGERWRLNARIENLLDRDYETAAGFRMQPRSAFAELQYAWR